MVLTLKTGSWNPAVATDGLGGENIYHRLRPLSRRKLSAQQEESLLTGRLDPALAGVGSFGTGAYVRVPKQDIGSSPLTGSAGRLSTTVCSLQ